MICGGCDDSDESDFIPRKELEKFVEERVVSLTGSEVSSAGEGMNRAIIPTPTWRKIGRRNPMLIARQHLLRMVRWAYLGLFQGCQGVNMSWELLVRK